MQADLFNARLTPSRVLAALADRRGAANGVSAKRLVCLLTGEESAAGERELRSVIEALRVAGHPVCATPASGYFLANTDEEMNTTCAFLYSRAMTSLRQVAGVKRVALPDLRGQLRLPITGEKS